MISGMLMGMVICHHGRGFIDPVLVSAAVDERIIFWDLYCVVALSLSSNKTACIPTFGCIERAFHLDRDAFGGSKLKSELLEGWPRLHKLIERHTGYLILVLSNHLFAYIIENSIRTDFLSLFMHFVPYVVLTKVFTDSNFDGHSRGTSFLELAIVKRDQLSIHTIIVAWSNLLNNEGKLIYSLMKSHVSILLEKKELLELADSFPVEFCELMKDVKLIKSHEDVMQGCKRADLRGSEILLTGQDTMYIPSLWTQHVSDQLHQRSLAGYKTTNFPVTSFFVPIREAADVKMLQAYVTVSESTDDMELFNSDVVVIAIQHSWQRFGKAVHRRAMRIYTVYVTLFSISNFATSTVVRGQCDFFFTLCKTRYELIECCCSWGMQLFVLIFSIWYLSEEYAQYIALVHHKYSKHAHFPTLGYIAGAYDYLTDPWNVLDLIAFLGTSVGILSRLLGFEDIGESLLAISSVTLYFKVLYYMKAYVNTGPLVSMIFGIAYNVRYFLFILALVLMGFAQAFWLISFNNQELDFGTMDKALLNIFFYTLGEGNYDFSKTSAPILGIVLLVVFLVIVYVLLLNILVALMSDTFTRIQSNGLAQWRLELCRTILDQQHVFIKDAKPDQYIHVLKRTEFLRVKGDEFHGRLSDIDRATAHLQDQNKKLSSTLLAVVELEQLTQKKLQKLSDYVKKTHDILYESENVLSARSTSGEGSNPVNIPPRKFIRRMDSVDDESGLFLNDNETRLRYHSFDLY
jgi:hypothetical protein